MAATFSYNADFSLAKDVIRLAIGDTGPTEWLFADGEIEAYAPGGALEESTNNLAAAALFDLLAVRSAGLVDISEGGASASLSQLAANYRAQAVRLRSRGIAAPTLYPTSTTNYGPAFSRAMGDTTRVPVSGDYEDCA